MVKRGSSDQDAVIAEVETRVVTHQLVKIIIIALLKYTVDGRNRVEYSVDKRRQCIAGTILSVFDEQEAIHCDTPPIIDSTHEIEKTSAIVVDQFGQIGDHNSDTLKDW